MRLFLRLIVLCLLLSSTAGRTAGDSRLRPSARLYRLLEPLREVAGVTVGETTLAEVRARFGAAPAGAEKAVNDIPSVCYRVHSSSSEATLTFESMLPSDRGVVTSVDLDTLRPKGLQKSCVPAPQLSPLHLALGLRIGMARGDVIAALGAPSENLADIALYRGLRNPQVRPGRVQAPTPTNNLDVFYLCDRVSKLIFSHTDPQ